MAVVTTASALLEQPQTCSAGSLFDALKAHCRLVTCCRWLLGGKPAVLDTAWKPAKDTEHVLAAVAAVQAQHWPVLESISTPEAFAKAWETLPAGEHSTSSRGDMYVCSPTGLLL